MTKEEIAKSIDPEYPSVYAPTSKPTKLFFKDGSFRVGYFDYLKNSMQLEIENKYTFIEFKNVTNYKETHADKYVTIVNGADLLKVEYPSNDSVADQGTPTENYTDSNH